VEYYTAIRDAVADRAPSPVLVDALAGRSVALVNISRVGDGIEDARRAVALSREMEYPAGEALALQNLSLGMYYAGDLEDAVAWARKAERIDQAAIPGWIARRGTDFLTLALLESGDAAAAWRHGADGLAQARRAGDLRGQASFLGLFAIMDQQEGRIPEAAARLRESLEIAARTGDPLCRTDGAVRQPVNRRPEFPAATADRRKPCSRPKLARERTRRWERATPPRAFVVPSPCWPPSSSACWHPSLPSPRPSR
jgi:tetratricopeptide (TPR) repeat protein